MTPEQTLEQHFGYDAFRPLQKEIVESVLNGNDTLALLPTGGGKSICFQVPALMMKGVCVVIAPLIALMKDQVENLQKKDIMAVALFSGMKRKEIEFELENCINGKYKFLYVSPERLKSKHFIDYALNIDVSLIAIDEAHCISQWGYDFRPPYLEIAEFKSKFESVKTIALTASATPDVVLDIQKKLDFKRAKVFQQSFVRNNLHYIVLNPENKLDKIVDLCLKLKGTGLIYAKSRRRTQELSEVLGKNKVETDYYHAGLTNEQRTKKQEEWKNGKTRIMICTNAFGMGIDKANVRFVIHEKKPDTMEAYYQEAGRAGRDGHKSYCVLLHNPSDISDDNFTIQSKYPQVSDISRVYELICNYLKVPVGNGNLSNFDFDINSFVLHYKLPIHLVYNCLKILEQEGYFQIAESIYLPSRLKIYADDQTLYEWQVKHENIDKIIKVLLRSYGGMFDFYTNIYEYEIARRLFKSEDWVKQELKKLHELELIDYIPKTSAPQIIFLENRWQKLEIRPEKIEFLRKRYQEKLAYMNDYAQNKIICRSVFLVKYFGEKGAKKCGVCDVCLEQKKSIIQTTYSTYQNKIFKFSNAQSFEAAALINLIPFNEKEEYVNILRWLKDNSFLTEPKEGWMQWTTKK